jgi:hypothetical protein
MEIWCGLVNILQQINLTDTNDRPSWKWTKNGQFSVKSVYKKLCSNGMDRSFKHLWKSKIPLKIKIWLWLIWHNAIATKDNLLKRNWTGSPSCLFCFTHETILHLFFTCTAAKFLWSMVGTAVGAHNRPGSFAQYFWWMPNHSNVSRNVQIVGLAAICWAIWKARNKACFEKIYPKNPVDLIYHTVVFMKYWAGAHSTEEAAQLNRGADALLSLAPGMLKRRSGDTDASNVPRLLNRQDDDMDVDGDKEDDDAGNLDD